MLSFFGKSAQFKRDLESNWNRLYRVAFALCHDQLLAEDLVQTTIEAALVNHQKIPDSDSLERWLFKVLVNKWRDYHRTKKYYIAIDEVDVVQQGNPEMDNELKETIQRVYAAMRQLSEEHREVLSLISVENFSYEQVAKILGLPIGTVMSRLSRSRMQLRRLLNESKERLNTSAVIRRIK